MLVLVWHAIKSMAGGKWLMAKLTCTAYYILRVYSLQFMAVHTGSY